MQPCLEHMAPIRPGRPAKISGMVCEQSNRFEFIEPRVPHRRASVGSSGGAGCGVFCPRTLTFEFVVGSGSLSPTYGCSSDTAELGRVGVTRRGKESRPAVETSSGGGGGICISAPF